jgi:hypothetical protein
VPAIGVRGTNTVKYVYLGFAYINHDYSHSYDVERSGAMKSIASSAGVTETVVHTLQWQEKFTAFLERCPVSHMSAAGTETDVKQTDVSFPAVHLGFMKVWVQGIMRPGPHR